MAKDITYAGGTAGLKVQVLPELKIRPNIQGEVGRVTPTGGSGPRGYYGPQFPPPAGAARPTEGVKADKLYYRQGEGSPPPDDGMAKGGKVRKTIPVKKALKAKRKGR